MNRALAAALAALIVLVLAPSGPARAQQGLSMTATPAFEGNYMPGAWLPIEVRLSNAGPPLTALVAAALPDSPFRNVQPVDLAGGAEKLLTLYVAMEQPARAVRLTVEADGAILAEQELAVRPRANERVLGVLADRDPGLRLPRRQDLAEQPFTVVSLTPAGLPDRPAGLSSLGLIVLSNVATDQLSQAQRDALLGWVSAGGHLVIGGGEGAQRALAGLPPQLQPAALGPATQIPAEPLAALAGAAGLAPLPGVLLVPAPEALATSVGEPPAWATRAVGVGAVTQLAFDPGLPALAAWPAAPQFWHQLLRPVILTATPLGLQPGVDAAQEGLVAGALTALPTLNLPPTDLIFGLLALYAILVGPGLALLLRRYDRQAWAWVAVPALAAAVGLPVFGLALALRPDQRVLNELSLVEMIGPDQARARTFVGALAPQSQTLVADGAPAALARPVRAATGQYGAVGGAGGDIAQESPTVDLSVEAWQLEGLTVEQLVALPGISAQVVHGPNGPSVELRNASDRPLRDVVAVYGERVARMGDIEPGASGVGIWPLAIGDDVPRGTPISYLVLQEALDEGRRPGQVPDRAVLARETLINAAVTRGQAADEGPFVLAWLDSSPAGFAVRAEGSARQSTTLLVMRPTQSGSGPVSLPLGWLRPDIAPGGRPPCFGEGGAGVTIGSAPLTVTMQLPPGLGLLRAEALTLSLDSTDPWPNAGVTTSLYDWAGGRWVEQDFDGPGDLEVDDPAPYLRGGRLLLQLDGQIADARCLYAGATLRGVLP